MNPPIPTPDEAFKSLMLQTGKALRTCGFKGSGQNYRRDCGSQWQAINIQKCQWRTRNDPISFYVNIGLYFPRVKYKRFRDPAVTAAKFIAIKADQDFRIEQLLPGEHVRWFGADGIDGWNLAEFSPQFETLLTARLVPLLDTMATPQGLADVLRRMPWMTMLGARLYLGPALASPDWDPADNDAGKWKKDGEGRYWGPGEW
jgi:hypothetical protein